MTATATRRQLIDGDFVDAVASETAEVVNPATKEIIATVPAGGAADVDLAVAAASAAKLQWGDTTPAERAGLLFALADAIDENAEELAGLESLNVGKPLSAAQWEIPLASDALRFFAGAARCLEALPAGEYVAGYTSMLRREPLGVAGLIAPWNYPLATSCWKLGAALAGGNTVVLKPSEQTPLTALRLAELSLPILPQGVLNVVTGLGETVGAAIVEHPDIRAVSLTGASATGREVAAAGAATLKRVHLELGGNMPVIVCDDADPADVAQAIRLGGYWNAGQDCGAASRVIASDAVYDAFVDELGSAVETLVVGDPTDESVEMGPLAYGEHFDRVTGMIERARAEGATFVTGGGADDQRGLFVEPTIVVDVAQDSELVSSEIFGPVVSVQRASDDAEALRLANDTPYGLSAAVFSRDAGRALAIARRLDFGTVSINDYTRMSMEIPWSGHKQSGHGTEQSIYALEDFTQLKHVQVKLAEGI